MFARVRRGFSVAARGTGYLVAGLFVGNMVYSYRQAQVEIRKPLPDNTVLKLDLRHNALKEKPLKFGSILGKHRTTTKELLEAMEFVEEDARVKGILLQVGPSTLNLAQAQELREGIERLKAKGKFTIAYAEDFSSQVAYYLATACDKVYVEPAGSVNLTGVHATVPFFKNLLDKLEIEPEMYGFFEYKNIVNTFTQNDFTPAHKESMESIIKSVWGQLVGGIAQSRGLKEEDLHGLVNKGPFTPREAQEAGLVDKAAPYFAVIQKAIERTKADSALFISPDFYRTKVAMEQARKDRKPLSHLLQQAWERRNETPEARKQRLEAEKKPVIAVVYALGDIHTGPSKEGITSHRMQKALRQIQQDENVKAVVLRVDSPGGSALASDLIYDALREVALVGKPVIASMAGVAASGGYYIAAAADKIIAEPGTITGSIGVAGGKLVGGKLADKVGVTFGELKIGENAGIWSAIHPFSPNEFAKFWHFMFDTYRRFVSIVATRRNMEMDQAHDLAKGRVWTGEQAHKLGLVDELGGLRKAIQVAKQQANIPEEKKPVIKIFPERKWHKEFMEDLMAEEPVTESHSQMHALAQLVASSPVLRSVATTLVSLAGVSGLHAGVGMSLGGAAPSGPLAQPSMAQSVQVKLPDPFRHITFL